MALCRYKTGGEQFNTDAFNIHSMDEVLTGDDSAPMGELEVFIVANGRWMTFGEAFSQRHLITDDFNTRFREPLDEEERARGYY